MLRVKVYLIVAAAFLCTSGAAYSDHPVAHTHIGINPTWRPLDWSKPADGFVDIDPTDDNKLWFFSVPPSHACATPGWPNWEQENGNAFLVLTLVTEAGEHITKPGDLNKVLYTCCFTYSQEGGYGDTGGIRHLDGWHSAFGPQGAWNLESIDVDTVPAWDIYIKRERVSSNLNEDDFFTLLADDTPALQSDGEIFMLGKEWQSDNDAWGIHEHMGFYFWLEDNDDEVYIVLSAHDAGRMYQRSSDYVMRFAKTVCRPVPGDLNGDGLVDINDLEILIKHWGVSGFYSGEDSEPHDHEHEDDESH